MTPALRSRVLAAMAAAGAIAAAVPPLAGQATPAPWSVPARDFIIHRFRFATGDTLAELRLHYRTLGRPRADGAGLVANAVLILHGTGGAGTQFLGPTFAGELFGPGQLLDTARYFVILPDDIGHGGSTKPSDGLKARFPHYAYADMVLAEHQLVTEGLHVSHLRLIIGTSMGCMHAWMWGELYPRFMDGLVPLACAPTQIAGRNRMWRKMAMNDIRNDPEWRGGEYTSEPPGLAAAWQMLVMVSSNPLQYQRSGPTRDAADSVLAARVAAGIHGSDANDLLYQLDASRDYDPSGSLGQIVAPVLAINTADDVINPPELGLMERLIPRVAHARYVLIPLSDATRGHGTHTVAAVWKSYLADFLAGLPVR